MLFRWLGVLLRLLFCQMLVNLFELLDNLLLMSVEPPTMRLTPPDDTGPAGQIGELSPLLFRYRSHEATQFWAKARASVLPEADPFDQ